MGKIIGIDVIVRLLFFINDRGNLSQESQMHHIIVGLYQIDILFIGKYVFCIQPEESGEGIGLNNAVFQ